MTPGSLHSVEAVEPGGLVEATLEVTTRGGRANIGRRQAGGGEH